MSLSLLKQSLLKAPIVKKGEYFYVVHPITDGVPEIKPALLREITTDLKKRIQQAGPVDKIVTMEAMGIPLASALSLSLDLPFTIIRKREYGLNGEISVEQTTGYSKAKLFINGLQKGEKIVLVDDVLSTGGTLRAVLSVLQKIGVVIQGIFIVIDKGRVADAISKDFSVPLHCMITIDIVDGNVVFV